MNVLRMVSSGTPRAGADAVQRLLGVGRALHALEHIGMGMLQRHVR